MTRTGNPTNPARKSAHGSTDKREPATASRCTDACVRPTPSQAHCPCCHITLGGVSGFDAHRKDGACLNPADLGMSLSDLGIWRTPMPADARARLAAITTPTGTSQEQT